MILRKSEKNVSRSKVTRVFPVIPVIRTLNLRLDMLIIQALSEEPRQSELSHQSEGAK